MAKPLTAAKNNSQLNLNNSNTAKLSVKMTVSELTEHLDQEFVGLFFHSEETAKHLAESFIENGYDESQPVHYAFIEDEGKWIVIDGMTRLHALQIAKFFDVPVYKHTFKTRVEALMYAYRLQLDRRNLDDAQKLAAIEKMIQINPRSKEGSLAKYISGQLNMGERNVKKAINILKNADEETKQAVFNHEKTINEADKLIQKEKKARKQKSFELEGENFWDGTENIDSESKEKILNGEKKFSEIETENKTDAGKTIYISGPITGVPDWEEKFNRAAEFYRKKGFKVVNPAELANLAEQENGGKCSRKDYLKTDIKHLLECDSIALLPGWQNSKGARLEKMIAEELELQENQELLV